MKPTVRLLASIAAIGLSTLTAQAAPAIWQVRDDDSAIWLFGSIHVLPDNTVWRSELFDQILAEADDVVFETDVRPAAAAQLGAEAFVRGLYADGFLLTDALDDAVEAQLRQKAAVIDLPMGSILAMRPWMAANTITMQVLAGNGYGAEGVEVVLQSEVPEARLAFLETGQEQLDVLAGASEDEQVAMLTSTLEQLDALPKLLEKMLGSWTAGTPDELGDLFLMELGGFEAAFLDRLIYARNRKWMDPIESMLADNQENLVIVGAAHLIGDGSVLDLLERSGYSIERIQ
ncbi:MAG TPA: TraB/GumN family protein [Devosia sp.]|jgi:hypothetical protein|nr:TraB/GumN family protein [Devosia sp.]